MINNRHLNDTVQNDTVDRVLETVDANKIKDSITSEYKGKAKINSKVNDSD